MDVWRVAGVPCWQITDSDRQHQGLESGVTNICQSKDGQISHCQYCSTLFVSRKSFVWVVCTNVIMWSECICNVCLISETNQRVQMKFDKEMLTLKLPVCRLQAPLASCFTVSCILFKVNEEFYYLSKKWLAFC